MSNSSAKLRRGVFLAALITSCLVFPRPEINVYAQEAAVAPAPKLKSLPVGEAFKNQKALKEKAQAKDDILKGNRPFDATPVTEYYVKYELPRLTSLIDANHTNDSRSALRSDLYNAESKLKTADLAAYNRLLAQYLHAIAIGNFSPAARINAVLTIGEMNEAAPAKSGAAPKPFSAASKLLLDWATKSDVDGIRAAALVGLERHIELSAVAEKDRNDYAKALLAAAKTPNTPGRKDSSHAWLVSRYLELLKSFEHGSVNEMVMFALDSLANENTHPILREECLLVVGKYAPAEAPEGKFVSAGRYSMRYLKKQCEQWVDLYDLSPSSSGGGTSGGYNPGGAYGDSYKDSNATGGYGAGYGSGGYGQAQKKEKEVKENPYEKQDAQTRALRRFMHEVAQTMRVGLEGKTNGDVNTSPEKGLVAKIQSSEERAILLDTLDVLAELQTELDSETVKAKSDLNTEVKKRVEQLIAFAEEYPGAVDLDEELIIEEAPAEEMPETPEGETPAEPAGDEVAARNR